MQQINPVPSTSLLPAAVLAGAADFPPTAMAQHLRRSSGPAALCFAQAMHADAAWANEDWAQYWAAVVELV